VAKTPKWRFSSARAQSKGLKPLCSGRGATVQYSYGAVTDSLVGRASSIEVQDLGGLDPNGHSGMWNLASYDRIGLGMTAKVTIAPTHEVYQPVLDRTRELDGDGPSGVYPAYDRFGRLTTHMWVRDDFGPGVSGFANGTPMLAVTHTYDRSSNRLSAHDARAGAKLPLRERGFSYDQLHRLIEEDRTPLPASSTYASQHRSLQWDLDMLGNWDTLFRDGDEDGDFADLQGDEHVDGRNHNAANEIQSNALVSDPNYDREVISTGSASWYHQHRYDDAGNMTDQRTSTLIPAGSGAMPGLRMAYDAWNRLVTTEHTGSGSTKEVSAYTYNALGWRTTKAFDASQGAYDGVMEQKRVFIYDASWRVIEEHIDIDADTSAGTDWISQQFWGLRYIDDLVAKRVDRDADADWLDAESTSWYFITDSQFSVSAVLNQDCHLWERVEYDAYGKARHRYAGDVSGDGRYNFFDLSALGGESALGDPNSDYHADFDVNFDGDILLTSGASADRDLDVINGRAGAMGTALPDGWISSPSASSGPDNSIGYAGYVHNPEREDYTVRFRVYAPELGRWRQRDPIGYVGGENLLAYVLANPVAYLDPSGLAPVIEPNGDEGASCEEKACATACGRSQGIMTVSCASEKNIICDCSGDGRAKELPGMSGGGDDKDIEEKIKKCIEAHEQVNAGYFQCKGVEDGGRPPRPAGDKYVDAAKNEAEAYQAQADCARRISCNHHTSVAKRRTCEAKRNFWVNISTNRKHALEQFIQDPFKFKIDVLYKIAEDRAWDQYKKDMLKTTYRP
jgi:RHS repeat-associated protein